MTSDTRTRNEFEREGFVIQRGLFSEQVVLLDALLEGDRERVRSIEDVTMDTEGRGATNLGYLGQGDDLITCFVTDRSIVSLASEILGEDVYLLKARLNVKWPNDSLERRGGWDPHQDRAAWAKEGLPDKNAVTVALAIDRCDMDNGAMELVPRSHRDGILEHTSLGAGYGLAPDTFEQLLSRQGKRRVDMNPGDALFFSGDLVHCSKPNHSNKRRALLFITYNAVGNSPDEGVGPSRYRYREPLRVSSEDVLLKLVADYGQGTYSPSLDYDSINRVREIDIAEDLDSGWTAVTPTLAMKFQPVKATTSHSTFFKPGEPIHERHWNRKRLQIFMPDGPKLYIRLQPTCKTELLSTQAAARLAVSAQIEPMRRSAGALGYSTEENSYGAVAFHCTSELSCLCLTQLHTNYEMWGIDAQYLATASAPVGDRPCVPIRTVEEVFTYTLRNFLSATERLGLHSPLRLECGLTEVEGYRLAFDNDTVTGNISEKNLLWDTTINLNASDAYGCLLPFFNFLWRSSGCSRPQNI